MTKMIERPQDWINRASAKVQELTAGTCTFEYNTLHGGKELNFAAAVVARDYSEMYVYQYRGGSEAPSLTRVRWDGEKKSLDEPVSKEDVARLSMEAEGTEPEAAARELLFTIKKYFPCWDMTGSQKEAREAKEREAKRQQAAAKRKEAKGKR